MWAADGTPKDEASCTREMRLLGGNVMSGRTVVKNARSSTAFLCTRQKNCGRQQFLPQSLALVADKFDLVCARRKNFVAPRRDSSESRPEIVIGKSTRRYDASAMDMHVHLARFVVHCRGERLRQFSARVCLARIKKRPFSFHRRVVDLWLIVLIDRSAIRPCFGFH